MYDNHVKTTCCTRVDVYNAHAAVKDTQHVLTEYDLNLIYCYKFKSKVVIYI